MNSYILKKKSVNFNLSQNHNKFKGYKPLNYNRQSLNTLMACLDGCRGLPPLNSPLYFFGGVIK